MFQRDYNAFFFRKCYSLLQRIFATPDQGCYSKGGWCWWLLLAAAVRLRWAKASFPLWKRDKKNEYSITMDQKKITVHSWYPRVLSRCDRISWCQYFVEDFPTQKKNTSVIKTNVAKSYYWQCTSYIWSRSASSCGKQSEQQGQPKNILVVVTWDALQIGFGFLGPGMLHLESTMPCAASKCRFKACRPA